VSGATVREPDGLALSSRNVRLGPMARRQARQIVKALDLAEAKLAAGERDHASLLESVRKTLGEATQATIEYAELRDPDDLEMAPATIEQPTLLAIALNFEPDPDGAGAPVRLIDNRILTPLALEGTRQENPQ